MSAALLQEYQALETKILAALRADLSEAEFNTLALEIHAFQRRWNQPYDAWCATKPAATIWQEIPAAPQAMFKRFRLSCIPEDLAKKTFRTSGTTGETRGEHHLLDTRLYQTSVLAGIRPILTETDFTIFLTPSPLDIPDSSLAHMFGTIASKGADQEVCRWQFLCHYDGSLNFEKLEEIFFEASSPRDTLSLFGTALSFLNLFEWLGERRLRFPNGSFALETGGFKGSGRDIPKADLYAQFTERLGLPLDQVWNEYGMCELASQFYTRGLNAPHHGGPWVRARVVSPRTGEEVAIGETGILRIYDLANLSSVLAIETADFATRTGDGFILLGRDPGATPRGCSRAADEANQSTIAPQRAAKLKRAKSTARPVLGTTRERAEVIARAAASFPFLGEVTADGLMEWIRAEFSHEDALDRFVPHGRHQARAIAPANILHILSRNTPAAALQTLTRGLLLGSANFCKLPTGGLPEVNQFVAALPESWRASIQLSEELPDSWLAQADAVVVFGSDSTIEKIHARVRPDQVFIPHGHKLSLAMVFEDPEFASIVEAARDISAFDQQGCLSPVLLLVRESGELTIENYARQLAVAMEEYAGSHPLSPLTLSETNAIHAIREETRFRAANGEPLILHAGSATTVIADRTPGIPSSPLNRVIHVKPLPADEALESLRAHLSTIGVWPSNLEYAEHAARLGALRVCPIGKMQEPPLTWHHDGQPSLAPLVKWVDWQSA